MSSIPLNVGLFYAPFASVCWCRLTCAARCHLDTQGRLLAAGAFSVKHGVALSGSVAGRCGVCGLGCVQTRTVLGCACIGCAWGQLALGAARVRLVCCGGICVTHVDALSIMYASSSCVYGGVCGVAYLGAVRV
jgi:hypothetical protein